jgi:hypothetical protein
MEDPKGLKLFKEVVMKTKAGRIKWEAAANESEYFAVLPGGVTLSMLTWEERGTWGWTPRIALIVRGDDAEFLRITPEVDGITCEQLTELHELARRQALSVDARVDKLLGELAKL